ncbi:FG-GAP-like repeat-containing protein [Streptomyces mesophilus]|uniref:FG-GAP-like repeat-containing protein n=1 Tax=Streptomyces mesophilus TaxID=1775132 RepID=UPI003323A290
MAAATAFSVTGLTASGAEPAASAEITVPATMRTTPTLHRTVMTAGSTGFLHQSTVPNDSGLDWTSYDGTTRRIEGGDGKGAVSPLEYYGAASDVVALRTGTTRDVAMTDMATGRSWKVTVPAALQYRYAVGETVVATGAANAAGEATEVHLLREVGGTTVDRKVTGMPADAGILFMGRASQQGFMLQLRITGATSSKYAWVDLVSGQLEVLPFNSQTTVTGRHIAVAAPGPATEVYEQGRFDAPVHKLPKIYDGTEVRTLGVVDNALIIGRYDAAYGSRSPSAAVWRVFEVPFDGAPEREILARAIVDRVAVRPDGGLILTGGANAEQFGFHAITADGSGGVRTELLHRVPPTPMAIQGVKLDQGRLSTVENGDGKTAVYTRDLTDADPGFGPRTQQGALAGAPTCSATILRCPALVPTGDGRTVYRGKDAAGNDALYVVSGDNYPGTPVPLDLGPVNDYYDAVHVQAARGDLALIRKDTTDYERKQYVVDIDDGRTLQSGVGAPSALSGDTLWTAAAQASDGKLTVAAKNARTGAQQAVFTVGSGCQTASDLQVVSRWLYWKCGSTAGVVDLGTGRNVPVPVVDYEKAAVLGDGFVVTESAPTGQSSQIDRYDVRSGTAVAQPLGKGGAPVVDPRTGDFAFRAWRAESGDWSDVRVIRGQQTAADLVSTHSRVSPTVETDSTPVPWQGEWWVTEKALVPTVTIKAKSTGKTVATVTGQAGTRSLTATWDGKGADGALLPNGTYVWSLSAQPADGAGPALTKTGTVRLSGGTAVRRDHAGTTARPDGIGDLLTLNSSGTFTFQHGTGSGTFSGQTSGSGWSTSTLAVPFGDLNGDRCNDVLVRMPDGRMRAYTPACGAALQPTTQHKVLGTGWNMHNVLTAAGDLTGDGRPDLVARKAATGELFVYRGTASGTVGSPIRVGSGWGVYNHIAGTGDLNGDGRADLLARHTDGTLYRYDGLGNGLFAPRAKVFTNWGGSYNAVIGAGDITGDGKADLVVRDKAGVLYRNTGDGKGSFSGRTQIATGWGGYKGIF